MKNLWKVLILAGVSGCGMFSYHVLTPAELADRGTREFPGVQKKQATEACASALATLGYNVTMKEDSTGIIKTAPKVIHVSATGGNGYANQREDALAWSVNVEKRGEGVIVHATPRGYTNGDDISARGFPDRVIDPKFQALWTEVSSTLKVQ